VRSDKRTRARLHRGTEHAIEWRFFEGKYDRIPALIAEFVHGKVDVIFAVNPETAVPAKKVTTVIPIVVAVGDPIANGLVESRPPGR